eukprot:GHVU01004985.1.p2 GENE.GHVU01004985.1~~GHVU01004985.1.p2  ORF type:complete len:114 (-),score=6.47 GHVU01004985.1:500-841(-)
MLAASQPRLARGAAHTTTAAAAVRTAATAAAVLQRLHHPTEIGESDAQIGRGPNKHTVVIVLSSPLHSAIHSLTDQVWSRIPFVYVSLGCYAPTTAASHSGHHWSPIDRGSFH